MPDGTLHRAYLALGSNIGPERNLPAAVRELSKYGKIVAVSRVWETAPVGDSNQANFLNAAVLLETTLSAQELKDDANSAIERALERVRDPNNKNAARTIDVDIALFDQSRLTLGSRSIPDPDLLERAFIAVPVAELDPKYVHPENGRTLAEIAGDFADEAQTMIARPDVDLMSLLPADPKQRIPPATERNT